MKLFYLTVQYLVKLSSKVIILIMQKCLWHKMASFFKSNSCLLSTNWLVKLPPVNQIRRRVFCPFTLLTFTMLLFLKFDKFNNANSIFYFVLKVLKKLLSFVLSCCQLKMWPKEEEKKGINISLFWSSINPIKTKNL